MNSKPAIKHPRVDHLVVAAQTLAEGVRWCEATFGVAPAAGGIHPTMGTHNALLKIASPAFPRTYLEIIAVDPQADARQRGGSRRWFDLDDAALQAALAANGPQLIHFVAEVPDATAAAAALALLRIDRGEVVEASRDTPAGRLAWHITVRGDGQRLFYGALPTLIQWGSVHPTDGMAESGIGLRSLTLSHARAGVLGEALRTLALAEIPVAIGPPNLRAVFDTPRGPVTLDSHGL
ncbi:VOC family protein [Variovorax saccharolyticus]|uniref:VOC family protein n=1 Tax=Variovorax saccharolyticus TaxID=3053516 RepID=UPI0025754B7D|nr:VOC family protein [Variovorax sp. J22R187]MDM0019085.1 VOC family protein [Variovorax sp. J22R187]